jgi:hypothetical protein
MWPDLTGRASGNQLMSATDHLSETNEAGDSLFLILYLHSPWY